MSAVLNLITALLLTAAAGSTLAQQRHGLPIHNFFVNPFMHYSGEPAEVKFTTSEVWSVRLPQAIVFGAEKAKYQEIFLHKKIPGYVFLQSPENVPPDVEFLYPKPYFKILNEFRERSLDEVKFYARVFRNGLGSATCLDKRFASKYKDEANQVFAFGRGGYFSPQTVAAVAFRRPAGQAMGGLAEVVFVNSAADTVVYLHYGNLEPATSVLQEAGIFGDATSTALPAGFSSETNVAQAGCWMFWTSDPSVPGGIRSANVDRTMRNNLNRDNERLGFQADRMVGCPCDQCNGRAVCVSIGSGVMRAIEGTAKCCRCQGLNSYLGNGLECTDTGSPLPVTYRSFPWPAGGSSIDSLQVNISLVQGNLDVNVQAANPGDTRLANLVKLSDPAWANLALMTASATSNATDNLFALGDSYERRIDFVAFDSTGSRVAAWTVEQSVWNRVLLKGSATKLTVNEASPLIDSILLVLPSSAQSLTTEYSFPVIERGRLRLESKPTSFAVSILTLEGQRDLQLNFTDAWTLKPTCGVETRVRRLLLERRFERSDLPGGSHFTRLTGTLTRLVSCADLTCGVGSECRTGGPGGQAACQCLPGYDRKDPEGPCRPQCGTTLCHESAECVLNKCMCSAGFRGDGLACSPDPTDCRKPGSACSSSEGMNCMEQAAAGAGVEHRCQCSSSKCIREADAACRAAVGGCSRFADCIEGINICACKTGFNGDGKICTPATCADDGVCADIGRFAFCNATRQCQVCAPPRVVVEGRCQQRPCGPGDCHEFAECNPVTNACVCRSGFTGDGVLNCSLACSTLRDCNREFSANDLKDLALHMQCTEGACQCKPGYKSVIDQIARTLSCGNCEIDLDCLPGATCQFEMRFNNARLCKCPEGRFGDGAVACHECTPQDYVGPDDRPCGSNAVCEAMPTGRVCRCAYGHSGPNPKVGCVKDSTRLMLNVTQLQLYEGQTDVTISCRVIRGPVRPVNLVWTSMADLPIPLVEEGRVAQFMVGDRKLLRISRVLKADSRELYCMPDAPEERAAAETLKVTVLDNPCRQCHSLAFCNYTRPGCQCSLGYSGDGVTRCDKASCTEQPLCDAATELCLYSQDSGRFECQCVPGLERADGRCRRRREGCETGAECHANAECALVDGKRQCRCREGFGGDGVMHCQRSGPGCNFHNRCVKNSECQHSQSDGKYRCVCTTGYYGNGDTSCRQRANCPQCEKNSGQCVYEPVEHLNLDGRTEQIQLDVCRCPDGTSEVPSNGQLLCRTPAQLSRNLYVAQGDSIVRIPAESLGDNPLQDRGLFVSMSVALAAASGPNAPRSGTVVALDYNCRAKEMIWSVYGHRQLYSMKADKASDAARALVPFSDGMEMVEGLAVDWTTGNVFYTAQYVSDEGATKGSRFGEIGVIANRRGVAYKKVLFRGPRDGVARPRGIAVDPFLGKLYYTDWDRADPRVMSAYMNGENHAKLASTHGLLPNDIVRRLDSSTEEVCYSSADHPLNKTAGQSLTPSSQLPIQCVWPSGDAVDQRNIRTQWLGEPFGLAYSEGGQFYWTNWRTNKIAGYSVKSGQSVDRGPLGGLHGRPMGIVSVSGSDCPTTGLAQKSEHACSESRDYGGCKYLCLAAPNGGLRCVCPDSNPGCTP